MKTLLFVLIVISIGVSNLYSQNISNVNPDNAQKGQTLWVDISGQSTNFTSATNTMVWFSQGSSTLIYPSTSNASSNTAVSSQFSIPYSANAGYYDVNVFNNIDGHLIDYLGFQIFNNANQPQIIIVDPDSAYQGQTLSVGITGQYTNFTSATNTLVWLAKF